MCKYEDREYLLLNALEYSHVYFYQLQAAASPAVAGSGVRYTFCDSRSLPLPAAKVCVFKLKCESICEMSSSKRFYFLRHDTEERISLIQCKRI